LTRKIELKRKRKPSDWLTMALPTLLLVTARVTPRIYARARR